MHDGFIHVLVLLFLAHTGIAQQQGSLPVQLPQVDIEGIKFNDETCPPAEMTEQARNSTKEEIHSILRDTVVPTLDGITGRCPCGGPGLWRRIAHLNMSDPNQQCPSNWQLITFPVRGCSRSSSANNTCDSAVFPSNDVSYSRVCGRINAIQRGAPDAFHNSRLINSALLEDAYVGGVSITHGAVGSRGHLLLRSMKLALMRQIGNSYFCDTGNRGPGYNLSSATSYPDDPLWDGKGCGPTSTCCQLNNPPWFCATLPQPTTDDIELRICGVNGNDQEDCSIRLADLYIL